MPEVRLRGRCAGMGRRGGSDGTILYLDCGGGYTTLGICLTSEPNMKKSEFHYM